jgi:hypothetical protein
MNQKLVESSAQVILSLSDEERQWLERELLSKEIGRLVDD